jgi:hypothetical protein
MQDLASGVEGTVWLMREINRVLVHCHCVTKKRYVTKLPLQAGYSV